MPSFDVICPDNASFTRLAGWTRVADNTYLATRLFFKVVRRPGSRLEWGEELFEVSVEPQVSGTYKFSRTYEVSVTDTAATAAHALRRAEVEKQIASKVAGSLKAGLALQAAVEASLESQVLDRWISELRTSFETQTTVTQRETRTAELTLNLPLGKGRWYFVSTWRPHSYDVYLTHIDFLVVKYEGMSRKRRKYPPGETFGWAAAPNVRSLQRPVGRFTVWEFEPGSTVIQPEGYPREVDDPSEMLFETIPTPVQRQLRPDQPITLHALAERLPRRR
jgi:hypothetical protein